MDLDWEAAKERARQRGVNDRGRVGSRPEYLLQARDPSDDDLKCVLRDSTRF